MGNTEPAQPLISPGSPKDLIPLLLVNHFNQLNSINYCEEEPGVSNNNINAALTSAGGISRFSVDDCVIILCQDLLIDKVV